MSLTMGVLELSITKAIQQATHSLLLPSPSHFKQPVHGITVRWPSRWRQEGRGGTVLILDWEECIVSLTRFYSVGRTAKAAQRNCRSNASPCSYRPTVF